MRRVTGHPSQRCTRCPRRVQAEKKAADKAAEGHLCEHGVNKCRICFPHKHNKELAHGHERKPQEVDGQE